MIISLDLVIWYFLNSWICDLPDNNFFIDFFINSLLVKKLSIQILLNLTLKDNYVTNITQMRRLGNTLCDICCTAEREKIFYVAYIV